MRDLELIPGFPGLRQNDVAARCSEPPFLTHGGQDDGSYTNSLKISVYKCAHRIRCCLVAGLNKHTHICYQAGWMGYGEAC